MPSYNTIAIVIRRLNFSETDKILTLYSRERGRFSAIAKGARKAVSRHSGATELLTCTNFHLATGKTMDIVTQTEVSDSFTHLRQDLRRLAHGLYLADLVDHSVEDNEANPFLFDLLLAGLTLVQRAPSPEIVSRWFELQLLLDLGYQPNLAECVVCRCVVESAPRYRYALSVSHGGVVCPAHEWSGTIDDHSGLSAAALNLLQRLEEIAPENGQLVAGVEAPDSHSLDQVNLALRRYLRYRIDRELKSLSFLDSLRHG